MAKLLTPARMLMRATFVIQLVLGLLLWFTSAHLSAWHILVGAVFVLSIWTVAAVIAFSRPASLGSAAGLVVVGAVVLLLGLTQHEIAPGDAHWVVQVVHLLLGLGAIGMTEGVLGRMAKSAATPA